MFAYQNRKLSKFRNYLLLADSYFWALENRECKVVNNCKSSL